MLRMTFTQAPRTYIQFRPNAVAAGQRIYTILDHDHIMIDEDTQVHLPTRPPINGTTPLLRQHQGGGAAAKGTLCSRAPLPPPHTPTQEEVQGQIDEMANPSPAASR